MLRWLEVLTYRLTGVREDVEQRWTHYTASLLSFSIFGFLLSYLMQRAQGLLPFNPQGFERRAMCRRTWRSTPPSASSPTPTGRRTAGESTLSYFVQMAALAVQNFASAAAGIAVAIALVRGFARQEKKTIGNFWVDVTRATVYILLPLSIVGGAASVLAGRDSEPQSLHRGDHGGRRQADDRAGAGGVAGSDQEAGTNGGGFFNANSAHPFENPTPLTQPASDVPDLRDPGGL